MVLTERSHKAVAINLDGRKVLTYNLDCKTYEAGCKCVTITKHKNPRYNGMRERHFLGRDKYDEGDGIFYLGGGGCGICADEHYTMFLEHAMYANSPAIEVGDRCAILCYSRQRNYTEVHTVVYDKRNMFVEETEEETMPSILKALRF